MARKDESRPQDATTPEGGREGSVDPLAGVEIDPQTGVVQNQDATGAVQDSTPGVAPPPNPLDQSNAAIFAYDDDLARRHEERRRDNLSAAELRAEDAARAAAQEAAQAGPQEPETPEQQLGQALDDRAERRERAQE